MESMLHISLPAETRASRGLLGTRELAIFITWNMRASANIFREQRIKVDTWEQLDISF